ncbi:MAG: O-antigen ligase family protein [Actinobacteria bacterium]|nr:O-antigen ligase family protein [Actinomycetota bacterium]
MPPRESHRFMRPWNFADKPFLQALFVATLAVAVGAGAVYSPLAVGGVLLATLLFLAISRSPTNGLYLIVLSIPFDSHFIDLGPVNLSASNLLIAITFLAWLAAYINSKFQAPRDSNYALLVLMIAGTIASTAFAADEQIHVRSIVTLLGCVLTYFLTVTLISNTKTLDRTLLALGVCATVVAGFAIIQAVAYRFLGLTLGIGRVLETIGRDIALPMPRVTATFHDPNFFGCFLLIALPALLYLGLFGALARRHRFLVAIAAALLSGGLFLSYSRGAWLGMLIALLGILYFWVRQHFSNKSRPVVLAGIAATASLFSVAFFDLVRVPFDLLIALNPESALYRLDLWARVLDTFTANPLFGIGFGGFVHQYGTDTHNAFMHLLVSIGLFGFLPFLFLYLNTVLTGVGNLKTHLGAALFVSLVGAFTATMFIDIILNKSIWFLLGLVNAAARVSDFELEETR